MRCPAGSTKLPRPPRTSAHTVVAFRAFSRAVKGRPRAAAAVNTRRVPSCWKPHASRNRTARACLVKGREGQGSAAGELQERELPCGRHGTAGRRTGQHESGRPWTPDSSSGTVPCPGVHELRSACKRCQHAGTNRCSTWRRLRPQHVLEPRIFRRDSATTSVSRAESLLDTDPSPHRRRGYISPPHQHHVTGSVPGA